MIAHKVIRMEYTILVPVIALEKLILVKGLDADMHASRWIRKLQHNLLYYVLAKNKI